MNFLVRLMTFPVPVFAGILYVAITGAQLPGGESMKPQGPEWLIGAVAGIWLVVWLLDKAGKLPTGGIDRRRGPKFEEQDREAIGKILKLASDLEARDRHLHGLLTYRSEDGVERWLQHHQFTKETRALLKELIQLKRDDQKKTGMLVSRLEANQRALVNIQNQLGDLRKGSSGL